MTVPVGRMLLLLVVALGAGCLGTADEGGWRGAITGGVAEGGFPYAGQIVVEGPAGDAMTCSASAVTPTVLLTAAHCLVPGSVPLVSGFTEASTLRFQTWDLDEEGEGALVDLGSRKLCPSWDRAASLSHGDVAVVRLAEPLELGAFPRLRAEAITTADVGTGLTAVGYGQTEGGGSAGHKRSVPMVLASNAGGFLSIRHPEPESWRGVCFGDSGGGSFVAGPGREVLYGVHSGALDGECGTATDTSVPRYLEPFLREAILDLDPGAETCGDGVCTGLERAEDCPADCAPPGCGDGRLDPAEACDDGNHRPGDGCAADCSSDETCGNGVVDLAVGETCEVGLWSAADSCTAACRYGPVCGNGILDVDAGEGCDDGNLAADDGCSAECLLETCGDGHLDEDLAEECDDGNRLAGDGCSPACLEEAGLSGDCACGAAAPRRGGWAAALLSLLV